MKEIFEKYGVKINNQQQEMFEKYYSLLVEYNNKFNITAITEKQEVIIKHFVDSCIGVDKFNCGKLIDVGSGGGFPAIPLKIMNANLDVTMIDATNKKCEFMNVVVKELGLKNIRAVCGRAEELAFKENFREKFDYCTARAVARLNILSEYCIPFVKKGGRFISFKGDATDEIEEGKKGIGVLGGKIINVDTYQLDGAKRTIIEIEKVTCTDKKYPRSNAKIRKNPL